MANSMKVRARRMRRFGIVGVIFLTAPFLLLSQGTEFTRQRQSIAGQPFAELDNSLSKAADTLLVSAAQTTFPATNKIPIGKTTEINPITYDDQRLGHLGNGSLTVAKLRLSLLRPAVEPILRSHGVPTDLAAAILIESGGRATALSPKGARGLWQLMPDTARRFGLRVDEFRDDRLDLFRSTDAAAQYLHDLHAQFGDWKLALAAYNTGEGNLGSAILRARTRDFDQLASMRMLPLETRNYVPRVLAKAQLIGQLPTIEASRSLSDAITIFATSNP